MACLRLLMRPKRILLFLREWLSTEGGHMDRDLLSSIGTFASTVSGSDTMKEVAREIVDRVGKNVCPVLLIYVNCQLTRMTVSRWMLLSHLLFLLRNYPENIARDRHRLLVNSRLPKSLSRLQ